MPLMRKSHTFPALIGLSTTTHNLLTFWPPTQTLLGLSRVSKPKNVCVGGYCFTNRPSCYSVSHDFDSFWQRVSEFTGSWNSRSSSRELQISYEVLRSSLVWEHEYPRGNFVKQTSFRNLLKTFWLQNNVHSPPMATITSSYCMRPARIAWVSAVIPHPRDSRDSRSLAAPSSSAANIGEDKRETEKRRHGPQLNQMNVFLWLLPWWS